jgi:hypothetical protein
MFGSINFYEAIYWYWEFRFLTGNKAVGVFLCEYGLNTWYQAFYGLFIIQCTKSRQGVVEMEFPVIFLNISF